jgi:hypothetical protein
MFYYHVALEMIRVISLYKSALPRPVRARWKNPARPKLIIRRNRFLKTELIERGRISIPSPNNPLFKDQFVLPP